MPYARNSDLPPNVRNVLPAEAQTVFRRVFNATVADVGEERAFRQAWGALENQGWKKRSDGQWVKKALVEKGPISYGSAHSGGTSKASDSVPWDGGAETRRAGNDPAQLRRMHAWVDPDGNPESKGSYKLPHHRADGTVVLRAVQAAMGALLGAHGGVDIPSADRRGVYNHLARHYRDFDRSPPELVQRSRNGREPFSARFDIKKIDQEQGLVFGWASVAEEGGTLVVDHEGDIIEPADLEKGAYCFVKEARVASDRHDPQTIGIGVLVESMFFSKDKQEALGIDVPVGWWVGFEIDDPSMRRAIREGEYRMFSVGGSAFAEDLS